MQQDNCKTTQEYWDRTHSAKARLRLPSRWIAVTRDLTNLLRQFIKPGAAVLEIGFAPGKLLSYAAKALGARVSGIDYSTTGVQFARHLFDVLKIDADLRCEDVFSNSFSKGTFDFVYSVGVIEHFEDPEDIVRCHVELLKPGGTALLLVPNYGGFYGRLQRYFDPENLAIHNLRIMSCESIVKLAPAELTASVTAREVGRLNPWLISFHKKWPKLLAQAIYTTLNGCALLQPMDVRPLCPMIALTIVRGS